MPQRQSRSLAPQAARYCARDARASPLYRLLQDHLEDFLLTPRVPADARPAPHPAVERRLRSFLECGIPRFGVARYRCPNCGEDLFVAFSCKRRGLCPSCDAKATASHCT